MSKTTKIYFEVEADMKKLYEKQIAIIGYGNQGRAQALNLRDSGQMVIIGNMKDTYKEKAIKDGFDVYDIPTAVKRADIVFILTPDETMPDLFKKQIEPNLKNGACINFASGYNIAFGLIIPPHDIDVILIAPRMIGAGVRENYLNGEGYYSFIGIHQDHTGNAKSILLALAKALGTLKKAAVEVTMKEEVILDLFNEQAFGPAFGRVLLTCIKVLIKNGIPPEAALIEMYMSNEMSYTYAKMGQIGLVKQTNFHSHTSQYGAMSRGMRYLKLPFEPIMQRTFDEIASGTFAREWAGKFAKLKFKVIKFFAMKQKINKIEKTVRKNLKLEEFDVYTAPENIEELLKKPEIKNELTDIKATFDF
ncbi:MAG: ketol-acid reductoisomerase [Promethearchaeota archaeon]